MRGASAPEDGGGYRRFREDAGSNGVKLLFHGGTGFRWTARTPGTDETDAADRCEGRVEFPGRPLSRRKGPFAL
ncbi:MAG: hypothetical protein GY859_04870 [Desulfobacterales bacterium]|nr:hypothetical protein [Desulfobacterales bacterium]